MSSAEAVVLDYAGTSITGSPLQSMLPTSAEVPVTVAVPTWMGMADRHQLMAYLNPDRDRPLRLISSPLCGTRGRYPGRTSHRKRPTVLCLDVREGWSAGLVRLDPDGATELAAWGLAPFEVVGLDDSETCRWFAGHVFDAAASLADLKSIRVLVVDDVGARAELIRHAVRHRGSPWNDSSVLVGRGRQLIAPGGLHLGRTDEPSRSIGALAHGLAVRANPATERAAMHVVVPQHARFPSTHRLVFELGPDDGASLHFDIYEQRHGVPNDSVSHRLVVRAELVRERGFDQNMTVTFRLGRDGLLSVEPANAWRLDWQFGSLDLEGHG